MAGAAASHLHTIFLPICPKNCNRETQNRIVFPYPFSPQLAPFFKYGAFIGIIIFFVNDSLFHVFAITVPRSRVALNRTHKEIHMFCFGRNIVCPNWAFMSLNEGNRNQVRRIEHRHLPNLILNWSNCLNEVFPFF